MDELHATDCVIFPIVVGNRHGVARYPLIPTNDTYKVDHELFEFYYITGTNVELGVFRYISDCIDGNAANVNAANVNAEFRHPDVADIIDTRISPVKVRKLSRAVIIAHCHLSYRAHAGELIAYYSAPFRVNVADDVLSRPVHSNASCGDGFAARFEFIANFIVNCYS